MFGQVRSPMGLMSEHPPTDQPFTSVKLVLLGESGVGKTALTERYSGMDFRDHHATTIGLDFISKSLVIDNCMYNVKIWDTAGQERFRSLIGMCYRNADAVAFVYDVCDVDSFREMGGWIETILNTPQNRPSDNVVLALIANKCDRDDDRVVTTQQGIDLANKYHMEYFETSAKHPMTHLSQTSIHVIIEKIVTHVAQTPELHEPIENTNIDFTAQRKSRFNSCCK